MSHGKTRDDKTCLNCGHQVEERFCPHCGQENIESRHPFYYLFTHFFEDFTHYDGQFWGTIKNLLFKPGKLTKIYLEGKRAQFVPPVKLYIFISFVTFLFISFQIADMDFGKQGMDQGEATKKEIQKKISENEAVRQLMKESPEMAMADSLTGGALTKALDSAKTASEAHKKNDIDVEQIFKSENKKITESFGLQSMADFDKKEESNGHQYEIFRPFLVKIFELENKGHSPSEITDMFVKSSIHNLPKALFLYLPLFAFLLWIFHSKRKWWYFDHGVFTLHYFSFLLLLTLLLFVLNKLLSYFHESAFATTLNTILIISAIIYAGCYFFIAHYKTYRTHPALTILVGIIQFMINTFLFTFLLVGLGIISFLFLH
ncbi:hypothetical protein B0A69_14635 [Chryseobacterium shigense]|uniref:DUF3667 domain-containing protein n=1 Tax=Chryseobacterium shigense TaxID=297244 RepID=A0A1N7IXR2_9FLAO|nr:DUF3667 domain-containing protein [Chryseobacterium shigense]PQA92284.1 hypothetical protein B0A69_14635 [Chryseobacterium shigense]SIS41883.1 Protein of unknown function [Chryseobacterium shigense]